MPIYSGTVAVAADDYYYINAVIQTGTTTIVAEENNIITQAGDAHSDITVALDLTLNPTITAATFHWYDSAYAKSPKATTVEGHINFSGSQIYQFTTAPTAASWNSHALTAGELANVNLSGTNQFTYQVDDPGASAARTWTLGAHEGSTDAYLVVEYTSGATAVARRGRAIVIG